MALKTYTPRDISVIVPVYNAGQYLQACLNSILNQTVQGYEIILVDDGSTDGSSEICDACAEKHDFVRVIHQSNSGQSAARNRGVEAARTELVCFIDSDDAAARTLLESFLNAFCCDEIGIAGCERVCGEEPPADFYEQEPRDPEILEINEARLLELFRRNESVYWTPFPCLVKKEIYQKHPLTPGRVMEDNAVSCQWLTEAKAAAILRTPLYFYRTNPSGTMQAAFSRKKLDYLWALEEQLSFYGSVGFTAIQGAVAKHYVECAIWFAQRVETELGDPALARTVIRKAVKARKQYAANGGFSPEDDRKLFKAVHPVLHRVKKKLRLP